MGTHNLGHCNIIGFCARLLTILHLLLQKSNLRRHALNILVKNKTVSREEKAELMKHIGELSDEETDTDGPPKVVKVALSTYRSAEVSF